MSEILEVTAYVTTGESAPVDQITGAGARVGELLGMHHSYRLDGRNYL